MNKYYRILDKILATGKTQTNKKGNIQYLLNEQLSLTPADLLDIFEGHNIARKKLRSELQLFMQGERNVEKYREAGINWWDYCGSILVNSYPTYFEKLPPLIAKINREKRNSKNYVLFLGETGAESNQAPCLSLVQFQLDGGELVLSAYQRSSDANLGLPSDIYHLYLMARQIELPLKSITLYLGNVHIYENNIPATNVLLSDLRRIAEGEPRNKRITGEVRDKMFARIEREEKEHGYVDYITISASLLFAMKYVTSLEGMKKEAIYNRIRQTDYPEAKDYLEGLTITGEDYKEVFKRYKDAPGVVFLVDPPYLSTEVGTYKMFWRLADYLDVLTVLKGHSFVYFTSNKSSILELCDWMDRNPFVGSPFKECRRVEFSANVNYQAKYTDMMLYTKPDEVPGIAA
ncbi:thymidylate synthase [Bacteroides caccae]|nr:thymidylate synthase [Bacteroides caccae]MCS3193402.1 thymidylate synthase [Bacteroides caccae]